MAKLASKYMKNASFEHSLSGRLPDSMIEKRENEMHSLKQKLNNDSRDDIKSIKLKIQK